MSWQLAAFSLLGLALAGGFRWYERDRPDARIVALVATLAALAALGRIAFAAVPNVKPTTDIVLIAGYALGGGPGFAVGAIAALSSNFFFGQGPWTPWQMVGWGLTGVLGAALAALPPRLRRKHGPADAIGRWRLALVCCVVGFGFTALQDVGDWVTYSDHSWAQLGAYVGTGLGFDAVHAAGCVGFALAIGPALTRSVQRFARRLQVEWVPPPVAAPALVVSGALALALAGSPARGAAATLSPAQAAARATAYLAGAQNADGGYGAAPGQPSDQLFSGWAALGLASAGRNPASAARGPGLLAYIRSGTASDPGSVERTILALRAAGLPAQSAGRNLAAELERDIATDGSVAQQVNWTAFAVLALRAAGVAQPTRTLSWLAAQQNRDGGFSFAAAGGTSDADDTGAALEALAGDPGAAHVRARAIAYLRSIQDRDGGFPSQPGMGSNAQSTAWVVQGLIAAGVAPAGVRRGGGPSPLDYLASLTAPNGSVAYARGQNQTPVWVTAEALMALEGRPLPVVGKPQAASKPRPSGRPRGAGSHRRHPAGSRRPSARPRPSTHSTSTHSTSTHVRRAHRSVQRRHRGTATAAGEPLAPGALLVAIGVAEAIALAPAGLG
ncbi:MAG: prenyltransferase/squalene oxidase repeat-containing protein [Solirubrobacteraceae bacterium]